MLAFEKTLSLIMLLSRLFYCKTLVCIFSCERLVVSLITKTMNLIVITLITSLGSQTRMMKALELSKYRNRYLFV